MWKELRGPEKVFKIGQWLIAILFAFFLIKVGGSIIKDLPLATEPPQLESFLAVDKIESLEKSMEPVQADIRKLEDKKELKQSELSANESQYYEQKESFNNWRSARTSTEQSANNPEVISRVKKLDSLLAQKNKIENELQDLSQQESILEEKKYPTQEKINELRDQADEAYSKAYSHYYLKVFFIRLAFVLPILILSIVLFRKYRNSKNWPFVWGFIIFGVFAFFFELVPYLPSFGGYIRYGVGVLLTFLGGRALMNALQAYVERKKQEQEAPQEARKKVIRYELALQSIAKNQCPSCERKILKLEKGDVDFCMHCGLMLHKKCEKCGVRHHAFFPFCPSCGEKDADQ